MRHFFSATQIPRLARKLESSSPGALFFITALNRRAVKEKECSLCLRTRPRVSFLCLCSPASFVPSSHCPRTRRERACRVARCIYLNRPGNCAFNISELFPRRERAVESPSDLASDPVPPAFHRSSFVSRSAETVCDTPVENSKARAPLSPSLALISRSHLVCNFSFTSHLGLRIIAQRSTRPLINTL